MNAFIPHVMPGTPPNQVSMLSRLMAAARAKSAAFICMIHDDDNDDFKSAALICMIHDDDNDDDNDDFMVLEDWFGLAPPPVVAAMLPLPTTTMFPLLFQGLQGQNSLVCSNTRACGGQDTGHRK
jgi:hypothetical protein